MADTKKQYRTAAFALGGFVAFCFLTGLSLYATSTMSFCSTFCHEMEQHAEELRYSPHAKDADGNIITCTQCHIPPGIGPDYFVVKAYSGFKDLFVHYVDQPESLDRKTLQTHAKRFLVDENCMKCHTDLYKDAKGEKAISELGKLNHDNYLGKDGQSKSGCAGCHVNMAHLPEFDRRLDVNKKFAERIEKKEALR